MPPFNMVVGAWTLEVEVVPLVMLELPVHPCGVKVRHQLIHAREGSEVPPVAQLTRQS